MSGSGSSGIVKSSSNNAGSNVSVDGEESISGGGFSSEESLSNEDWLSDSGSALAFEVNLTNNVEGSGPCASDGHSACFRVDCLGASEVGDISCGILLGVSRIGLHDDSGGVEGEGANLSVDSLNPDVIESVGVQVGDFGRLLVDDNSVDNSGGLLGVVESVDVVVKSSRVIPSGADGDDVSQACVP
jgi:hypothetical protein